MPIKVMWGETVPALSTYLVMYVFAGLSVLKVSPRIERFFKDGSYDAPTD